MFSISTHCEVGHEYPTPTPHPPSPSGSVMDHEDVGGALGPLGGTVGEIRENSCTPEVIRGHQGGVQVAPVDRCSMVGGSQELGLRR